MTCEEFIWKRIGLCIWEEMMLIMADLIAFFAHHVIYSDVTDKEIGFMDSLLIIVTLAEIRKQGIKAQAKIKCSILSNQSSK